MFLVSPVSDFVLKEGLRFISAAVFGRQAAASSHCLMR
jgi:hypothetical protein